jgi:hypothetical protein
LRVHGSSDGDTCTSALGHDRRGIDEVEAVADRNVDLLAAIRVGDLGYRNRFSCEELLRYLEVRDGDKSELVSRFQHLAAAGGGKSQDLRQQGRHLPL